MSDDRRDLKGLRVLILGGSGVLGFEIAGLLHAGGAQVMLAGRDAARLQMNATALGADVPSVLFDLAEPAHAAHVVSTAVDALGGLDGVINAAGVVAFGTVEDLDDDTLDALVSADFTGPLRVIRQSIPHLAEGGFIVSISGVVAETPVAGMAAYSAVKSAMSSATVALGRELRRRGIHVLDVRPPHTETGLADRAIAGAAPRMPEGLEPGYVARVIVDGVQDRKREIAAAAFGA